MLRLPLIASQNKGRLQLSIINMLILRKQIVVLVEQIQQI